MSHYPPEQLIATLNKAKDNNSVKIAEKQNVITQWNLMTLSTQQEIATLEQQNIEFQDVIDNHLKTNGE